MVSWLHVAGPVVRQSINSERRHCSQGAHLLLASKLKDRKGAGTAIYFSRACASGTYFLQQGTISPFLPTSYNAVKLWTYQCVHPLMKSEPLWSNRFLKVPLLNTAILRIMSSIPEELRGHFISYLITILDSRSNLVECILIQKFFVSLTMFFC
jgi:hypothetical protein